MNSTIAPCSSEYRKQIEQRIDLKLSQTGDLEEIQK